ncbi:MAG: glycosyltransferase family 4 protein [Chloroflexaceae bacterium]|nr:glycosyltransferase family 4 protein [Chloroflexaceae bacterium]
MGRKKILYIITRADLGGAQSYVKSLLESFQHQYELHLIVGKEGFLTEASCRMNVEVHLLPRLTRNINLKKDFFSLFNGVNLITKIAPSLIHANSSKAGLIGRFAGKVCKIPTIFTAHGWGFAPGSPISRSLVAKTTEKIGGLISEKIICVSESDRQLALKYKIASSDKLITIRCGIANDSVMLANSYQQPPHIIMVARFNEQKDQETLLKAVSYLKNCEFSLSLVGSGPSLTDCKALAQTLGISSRISFLGDRTDVPQLLAQAQIFVLSTHYEGLPISIIEAMRAGLCVVATDVNGVSEAVVHRETGLLVPHSNVDALALAIEHLINFPEQRNLFGKAGRQKFLKEFTLERMIIETEAIYKQFLT